MDLSFLSGAPHPVGLLVVAGSRAYGLDHADSDVDYRGFFVAPTEAILGVTRPDQTWVKEDPDVSVHEVEKFVGLALKANPTVLEVLATPDPVISSPLADELRANLDAFLSNQVRERFYGYAKSQLKVAVSHADQPNLTGARSRAAKPARHFLRVIQQGGYLLRTGALRVLVPNRDELFAFGELPVDKMAAVAEIELARFDATVSVLPDEPDVERINEILVRHRILGLNL